LIQINGTQEVFVMRWRVKLRVEQASDFKVDVKRNIFAPWTERPEFEPARRNLFWVQVISCGSRSPRAGNSLTPRNDGQHESERSYGEA
jgi:hypothetical protein